MSTLDGKTITLLDISKAKGDHLLDRVEELLLERASFTASSLLGLLGIDADPLRLGQDGCGLGAVFRLFDELGGAPMRPGQGRDPIKSLEQCFEILNV